MQAVNVIIGIIMVLSFFGLVWYCVKGYNLLVGFFVMSVLWTTISLIGNSITPNSAMEGATIIDVLTNVFQTGPENYGKSILVNIFFGAFFGRVLIDTGIAATLIRKVVELGGDKPRITMSLLCIVTTIIFTSMTGIGPVISIAVIVLPIMLSLGIPAPIAMFSFMGSIMAGIFGNIVNFKQYQAIFATANESYGTYDYNTYFPFGMIALVVALIVVLVVSNVFLSKKKVSYAWAVTADSSNSADAPIISWICVVLPVIGVILFKIPIILAFIISGLFALITCGKLRGGFTAVCRMLAKQFADGAIDVAPMIGFLLTLSMFNNAANYASPYFKVLLGGVIPESALLLSILFAVLTPLGFFRGPMNLVGCGAAILAVVVSVAAWPVQFLFPLFAITTIAPQHLDVTQSWVAWGFGYTKVATKDYLKMSIPTGWIIGIILCIVVYVLYGGFV
ncbi:citrate transporter [Candidatus Galacturonibacter soehngenii]|uniref:Citrate transporter n=1 Tax=Candidatus Galacturonatibacter soehngenii TaxID=2307010 RepID=A0A7V7QII4_9FIRM|nr:citrate transporter [Candidatus Galacturonibacter soehngenii]KAB1436046.1 citrate transporter [Candidatus Galacturonibacter soehngenii]